MIDAQATISTGTDESRSTFKRPHSGKAKTWKKWATASSRHGNGIDLGGLSNVKITAASIGNLRAAPGGRVLSRKPVLWVAVNRPG